MIERELGRGLGLGVAVFCWRAAITAMIERNSFKFPFLIHENKFAHRTSSDNEDKESDIDDDDEVEEEPDDNDTDDDEEEEDEEDDEEEEAEREEEEDDGSITRAAYDEAALDVIPS